MTPNQLAAKIRKLPELAAITTSFERILTRRRIWNKNHVSYITQKDHWLGWLSAYRGPGYYRRKNWQRSEFVYNHVVCPPMVLWLGEASGVPKAKVAAAKRAAMSTTRNLPAKSAAIRNIISWNMIERRLDKRGR
jgi:hypothetical protein